MDGGAGVVVEVVVTVGCSCCDTVGASVDAAGTVLTEGRTTLVVTALEEGVVAAVAVVVVTLCSRIV